MHDVVGSASSSNVPAAHMLHRVAPPLESLSVLYPLGQTLHGVAASLSWSKVPAGQMSHPVAPVVSQHERSIGVKDPPGISEILRPAGIPLDLPLQHGSKVPSRIGQHCWCAPGRNHGLALLVRLESCRQAAWVQTAVADRRRARRGRCAGRRGAGRR